MQEVKCVEEALEDPPEAADAVELLDEVVEGALLEAVAQPRYLRNPDLLAGGDVCLEGAELEEQLPQRRRRPCRRA